MSDNLLFSIAVVFLSALSGYLVALGLSKKDDKGMFYFIGFILIFFGMMFLAFDRAQFVQSVYENYAAAFEEIKGDCQPMIKPPGYGVFANNSTTIKLNLSFS